MKVLHVAPDSGGTKGKITLGELKVKSLEDHANTEVYNSQVF